MAPRKPAAAKKGKFTPPADETKRQKFERIVTARMNRVLNSIRLLGNLASPNYEWDQQEIQLIRTAIADQLNLAMSRFEKARPRTLEFRLPERTGVEDL